MTALSRASFTPWDAAEAEEHVRRAWQDIRIAIGAAKLLEISLDDPDVPVRPLLMLTGPGVPELPEGHMLVKGVRIVDVNRPELWMHLFDAPVIDDVAHRRLLKTLPLVHLAASIEVAPKVRQRGPTLTWKAIVAARLRTWAPRTRAVSK